MKKIMILIFLGFSSMTLSQKLIDKLDFDKMRADLEVQILDVRTLNELQEGYIPEAIHIDYFLKDFIVQCSSKLDKKKPLVVYCASGGRSSRACKELSRVGFKIIFDLDGGYDHWKLE